MIINIIIDNIDLLIGYSYGITYKNYQNLHRPI